MEFNFNLETTLQLLLSFLIGTMIGLEREYRSKAAGLRTMIMICLGSTLFTELSITIGVNSPDRIASNIITGIGFLGAGVIFKDGLTISGITTATTIWITAALGMAVGAGEYFIATAGSIAILSVLTTFEHISERVSKWHQERVYKITLNRESDFGPELEKALKEFRLRFKKEREIKGKGEFILMYAVNGTERHLTELNKFLIKSSQILAFEY